MKQTFTIPGRLPGRNEVTRADRGNRYAANKLKRETQEAIAWAAKAARIKPVTRPVTVTCTWYERDRRRDVDNVQSDQCGKTFDTEQWLRVHKGRSHSKMARKPKPDHPWRSPAVAPKPKEANYGTGYLMCVGVNEGPIDFDAWLKEAGEQR